MTADEIKQLNFDTYVRELDILSITDWSIIDIENFKHLAYESVSDMLKKDASATIEASTSSVSILKEMKLETTVLHSVLSNAERSALVKSFNDPKISLMVLVTMYSVGSNTMTWTIKPIRRYWTD